MKERLTETLVGLVVLIVAGVFAVYAANTMGSGENRDSMNLKAEFNSIGSAINTGADIRLAGVKVGTVTEIKLDAKKYEAVVTLNVRADLPIPDDSVAKITTDGLLGAAYISIEPGADDVNLKDGDSFQYTQGAVDLMGLLSQFASGKDTSGQ